MPVFQEFSRAERDLRVLPLRAPPLPRFSRKPANLGGSQDNHEVVVIGVSNTASQGLLATLD